ncbi:sensor histidine kinase [Microterricola viridarii]|uniref:histidine kinase n=1 Tax=Microterricola viridarii TaxID=412690 RepID=A0A1H1WFY8_9MICO|nr:histidine kinase [Microterricola viridarii]SDS95994.1 Signal transduction histidine kinase [Microterricola viridarii]
MLLLTRPRVVDALVALSWVIMTMPTLVITMLSPHFGWPAGVAFAGIVLAVAAVLFGFRRRRPLVAFWVTFVLTLPLVLVSPDLLNLAAAYCAFAVAVYDSVRNAWLAAAASAVVTVTVSVTYLWIDHPLALPALGSSRIGDVLAYAVTGLLVLLVALFWGQSTGNRRRYIEGLLEHARQLERERDQQAQLAALAERSRIARDVHDIVSHSLSVIVRLADGANAVFDREPERAREAIAQLGTVARSSLTEMRRVIGVLESTPGSASAQSGAGFDDLPRLVEVYRGVGLPVSLTVIGDAPPQSGVQVAVFRVVQEALTNALRHASSPTAVDVLVRIDDDVSVTAVNDGAPAGAPNSDHVGRGLVGMRERAALYGGTLAAAPDGAGRWAVRLTLPGAGR